MENGAEAACTYISHGMVARRARASVGDAPTERGRGTLLQQPGRGMVPSSLSQEAKWAEKPNHPESPIRALYIYRAEEQSHVSQFR